VLARTTVADVQDAYPHATVFRIEPNTPVALRKGVLAFAQSNEPEAETVKELFSRVGTVVEVPERLMAIAGAISGVGPAYWALFVEAWVDAAVRHGMPAAQAATLVRETMAGTAALLEHTDTLALRRAVASPGGTTARGLAALERGGVRAALAAAMDDVVGS
jgi:pyrroline-5-carboxylate reductase